MENGTAQRKHGILIVDDHPLIRAGLTQIIKRQGDLFCCGETSSVSGVRQAVTVCKPSLLTIDLRLPDGDGLELIRDLATEHPSLPVLVITQCDEMLYAVEFPPDGIDAIQVLSSCAHNARAAVLNEVGKIFGY